MDGSSGLQIPYVRPYILARMAAAMGMQFVTVAVGWELYERTRDAWALGLVGAAQVLPAMVLALPAGNLADRFPRRYVAMLGHALYGLAALGLAVVSWLSAPVGLVYALLLLSGIGRAFSGPSVQTLLAQLLTPRQFGTVYAWQISTVKLAAVVGPAIGGLLIAVTGAATSSYLLAALGHFLFVATLTTMPAIAPARGSARPGVRDLFAGVIFIRRTPIFLAAITLDLFAVLLGGAVALLPIFARDILEVGPSGLGLLRSAPAIGAMLAALIVARLPPWQRPGRVLLLTVAGFGVATIGFGLSRDLTLSLACLFLSGAFDAISVVIRGTLEQVVTPDRLRGRVAAIDSLFVGLSNELGAFESGATAALFGPVVSVVGGGIGTLVVVALVALGFPTLARVGPIHTLHPAESPAAPGVPEPSAVRRPELTPPAPGSGKGYPVPRRRRHAADCHTAGDRAAPDEHRHSPSRGPRELLRRDQEGSALRHDHLRDRRERRELDRLDRSV